MNLIFDLDDTLYDLMGPFELVHKKLYADKTDADCTELFIKSRDYSDEIMEAEIRSRLRDRCGDRGGPGGGLQPGEALSGGMCGRTFVREECPRTAPARADYGDGRRGTYGRESPGVVRGGRRLRRHGVAAISRPAA